MNTERNKTSNHGTHALRIRSINRFVVIIAAILAALTVIGLVQLQRAHRRSNVEHKRYEDCAFAANTLMTASDYLTTQSRLYVITGEDVYLNGYLTEVEETRRREHAVDTLKVEATSTEATKELARALAESDNLASRELYAMRLACESYGMVPIPDALAHVELSSEDTKLSTEEKRERAKDMLVGFDYEAMKTMILQDVERCTNNLLTEFSQAEALTNTRVHKLTFVLTCIAVANVLIVGTTVVINYVLVMKPIRIHSENIQNDEPLCDMGSQELRTFARAYNSILDENRERTEELRHRAETDPLTGLLNRSSYERLIDGSTSDIALAVVDVDHFKQVNDTYGHEIGDAVLRRVGASLMHAFRSTDYVCRIGGDEFAVVLTNIGHEMQHMIAEKFDSIFAELRAGIEELPPTSLSVGVAFSSTLPEGINIYHAADKALYDAKHESRNCYRFYDGED